MDAVQIIAEGARAEAHAAGAAMDAEPALEALAWSLIEVDEDRWRIDAWPASREEAARAEALLRAAGKLRVRVEALADADWLAMALSGLPPVRAGRFFVYGAHDAGRVPASAVALRIEAEAAFGTGHHGTTVGCLLALDALLKARRFSRVLDVGTGTGVLAIAAARSGSRLVLGTDIDPVSAAIARRNARLNGARCAFFAAGGLAHPRVAAGAPYELVFANILAAPLVALAPDIRGALAPGGVAILSGLLRTQSRRVLAAYVARGFKLKRRIARDAWMTLVVERRG
jgi:ribosomal protein L11 methyltransferase